MGVFFVFFNSCSVQISDSDCKTVSFCSFLSNPGSWFSKVFNANPKRIIKTFQNKNISVSIYQVGDWNTYFSNIPNICFAGFLQNIFFFRIFWYLFWSGMPRAHIFVDFWLNYGCKKRSLLNSCRINNTGNIKIVF